MPVDPNARAALHRFLVVHFDAAELRWLVLSLSPALDRHLEWKGSLAEVAGSLVVAADARGLVDEQFFRALVEARPDLEDDVRAIAASWGAASTVVEIVAPREIPGPAATVAIDEAFRTTGVPELNFVTPAQLGEIAARLRISGEALVVEGASGIGKTTAVRRAVGDLAEERPKLPIEWVAAKDPQDRLRLADRFATGAHGLSGLLVVDDFHHLSEPERRSLADLVKVVADLGRRDAKIVIIGINPVGDSLVMGFPDVALRFAVVRMNRQPDGKVRELIVKGEAAVNVSFLERDAIVQASRGSLYTAQVLCLEMWLMEGVVRTLESTRPISAGPHGPVADRIRDKLKPKYHARLRFLSSFGQSRPPAGAVFALLWLLGREFDEGVSIEAARTRFPELGPELGWLLQSNLKGLLDEQPELASLFFYNRGAGVLSAEDPRLDYYLALLSWPALARDAGLRYLRWDAGEPVLGEPAAAPPIEGRRRPDQPRAVLLHLSDLHLASRGDASTLAGQLREDLQHGLGFSEVSAVVVSGDVATTGASAEYDAAADFFLELRDGLRLGPERLVLVPGNHDLDWNISRGCHHVVHRDQWKGPGEGSSHFEAGEYVEVARSNDLWQRFKAFANPHFEVRNEPYSLDPDHQATVHHFADARLLVLGMNSAWRIDHRHPGQADINGVALGRALARIDREPAWRSSLRLAVWHHPVTSGEDDRIADTGFLERLVHSGFRVGLCGHLHRAQATAFRLDISADGRRMDILGAGTAGAPSREWRPGFPLQYQVLVFEGSTLTVHTRCRDAPSGAWKPDARWTTGPGTDPLPRYVVDL